MIKKLTIVKTALKKVNVDKGIVGDKSEIPSNAVLYNGAAVLYNGDFVTFSV